MVRSKTITLPAGRKQRIEGIVRNLSAKVLTNGGGNDALNGMEGANQLAASFQDLQRRTELQYQWATRPSYPNDLVYHLPQGLEFSGVVCSQPLLKGRRFGPFHGRITPGTDQFIFNHTCVCQIPDLDGNPYSLHLLSNTLSSCNWLKCLQRCSLQGVYNVVAYNTPRGVVLEVVAEAGRGTELCVAYDQSYDVAEGSRVANEVIEIPSREPTPERRAEAFSFTSVGVPNERHVMSSLPEAFPCLSDVHSETMQSVDTNDRQDQLSPEFDPPYTVLTADVTQGIQPVVCQDRKPAINTEKRVAKSSKSNAILTNIKENDKNKKTYVPHTFRCDICKKQFSTVEDKQQHMDVSHTGECPVCKKIYSRTYLKEHMMYHLESKRLTCTVCAKVFSSKSNLRKHQHKHTRRAQQTVVKKPPAPPMFQCSCCQEKFKSGKELEVHKRKHGRGLPIQCNECNQTFPLRSHFRRHRAVVHMGKKTFPCRVCHNTFTQKGNLARHYRLLHSHTKEVRHEKLPLRFQCRRRGCIEAFTTRDQLIKHLEKHTGRGGVFPCEVCNGVFSSASNLKKHKNTLHLTKKATTSSVLAKYSCEPCNRAFQNEYVYRKHLRSHRNRKDRRCEHCGRTFANSSGLAKHIRLRRCASLKERKATIKPEKTFQCNICSKNFHTSLELKTHRRTHLADEEHICNLCGKHFSQRGNLAKHKRHVHHGVPRVPTKSKDKALQCGSCERTFRNAGSLELHTRMHFDQKPVKCEYCDRRFSNMGGRKKHMMSCSLTFTAAITTPTKTETRTGEFRRSLRRTPGSLRAEDPAPEQRTEETKPRPKNTEPRAKNIEPTPTNIEPTPTKIESTPKNIESTPTNIEPTPTKIQPTPTNIEPTPTKIEPTPTNIEPTPTEVEPTPTNIEPTPTNIEPTPTNIEPTPTNTESTPTNTEPTPTEAESSRKHSEHPSEEFPQKPDDTNEQLSSTKATEGSCRSDINGNTIMAGRDSDVIVAPSSPVF